MAYDAEGVLRRAAELLVHDRGLTVSGLSRRLGVDRHTLAKAVRSTKGITLRDFRRRMVFDESVLLLRTECRLSIKEVAFRLGFTSQRSFTRLVKSISGMTPSQLRKSN